MQLLNFKEPIDLSDYTLIIPSVSVGNVPQLTVDLLITTLKLKNVAALWHPGLVASVGADPFYSESKILCTACELYANIEKKVAALQIRSTIETRLIQKFFSELIASLLTLNIGKVVILATGFDYELHNIAEKDTFHYITNTSESEVATKMSSVKPLLRSASGKLIINGAGFGPNLYEAVSEKLKCILIVKYVSEGENIFDAQVFLNKLFQYINVSNDKFVFPSSWKFVYGAPPPIGLF